MIDSSILNKLELYGFVAVDIETTGLDFREEKIIEFAAVVFENGEPADRLNFYLNPGKPIPAQITRITGITDEDVSAAAPFPERLDDILSFIGNRPLVAHNVDFDLPFLEYSARVARKDSPGEFSQEKTYHYFRNAQFDTLALARFLLPFQHSFRLGALAENLGIETKSSHRALPDAEMAGRLFLTLLQRALQLKFPDVQKVLQILDSTGSPLVDFFQRLALLLSNYKVEHAAGIDALQFSVSANLYNIIGEDDTPANAKTETAPINSGEISEFFSESGALAQNFGRFEIRPQQEKMATAIARAFNEGNFLAVEAGTGTGKSLAYLLPALKWAIKNYGPQGRVIISTNTKNLQEQLFFKDLPVLHSILGPHFKAVLLKGKANYLCLDKWVTALKDMDTRLSVDERLKILPLYLWVTTTETGDISENNGFRVERNVSLWTKFIAENNYCPGKSCKFYDKCFLMRARNNARNAHLVLVNHSLLFSDLAADQGILGDYSNLILDEAHNVEKTATEYLGYSLTIWNFRDVFRKLYQKEKIETGILQQLYHRVLNSSVAEADQKFIVSCVNELKKLTHNGWRRTQDFFGDLTRALQKRYPQETAGRYAKFRYKKEDEIFAAVSDDIASIIQWGKNCLDRLSELLEYLQGISPEALEFQHQIFQEITAQRTQLQALLETMSFLTAVEFDDYVYWLELPQKEGSSDLRLYAAPLNISKILKDRLYDKLRTAVFTSATLTVNRRFDYFLQRTGLNLLPEGRVNTLLLNSPFRYDEQVFFTVPAFFPSPQSTEYLPRLQKFISRLAEEERRGTLILFTSYAMLNRIYASVRPALNANNVTLLGQGIDGGRHSLLTQFKSIQHSFLLGTDSFWEGIDVPGNSLEVLVMTRLPFDVPSEPVFQAKSELIQKEGRNSFMEFAVPEAIVRFRQGIGRLIRSKSDYGAIIVLDTRLVSRRYGRLFLNSLPFETRVLKSEESFWSSLKNWFGNGIG